MSIYIFILTLFYIIKTLLVYLLNNIKIYIFINHVGQYFRFTWRNVLLFYIYIYLFIFSFNLISFI